MGSFLKVLYVSKESMVQMSWGVFLEVLYISKKKSMVKCHGEFLRTSLCK
jgi:hypothetical protein